MFKSKCIKITRKRKKIISFIKMNDTEVFIKWVLKFLILAVGLVGNSLSLVIFTDQRVKYKFPNRSIYITLSIVNTFYLVFLRIDFILYYFNYDLRSVSSISMKISRYLSISLAPITAWMNVFNTLDSLILFRYPQFQMPRILIIILIIAYNLVYYTPILNYTQLLNQTITETSTSLIDKNTETLLFTMDLVNSTVLPFIFMLLFSIMLIKTMFKLNLITDSDRSRIINNIKLAFSAIMINLTFFVLILPVTLFNVLFILSFNVNNYVFQISKCIYQSSFCVHFYVLILFNSIFREKLFIIFKLKRKLRDNSSSI